MTTLLINILKLGKIDAALARVFAEKKKLENEIKAVGVALEQTSAKRIALERTLADKKFIQQREEKSLKEETEQLVKRRKSLASLGSYKTQQAASREIEHAGREIGGREEVLIRGLTDLDDIDKKLKEASGAVDDLTKKRSDLEVEAKHTLENLNFREATYSEQRRTVAAAVDQSALVVYNKVKDKYPMNPAVVVNNGTCSGCFMQVAPQLVVQIGMAATLVRCRGCNRILYLPEQEVKDGVE